MSDETTNSHQRTLSAKHQEFVNWYLRLWNQTEAYMRVYPNCSPSSARANATRLIANASISAEVERRKAELIMSADEVLTRLTEQARAAYSDYFTAEGTVDLERLLADGKGHLIKKIKPTKDGLEVEFYDAQAALVQMAKKHALLTEKSEVNNTTEHRVSDKLQRMIEQVYGSQPSDKTTD